VVDTFVEMFEMEIVEKKGTSCRRLQDIDVPVELTRYRCACRTHKISMCLSNSQDDDSPCGKQHFREIPTPDFVSKCTNPTYYLV